MLFVDWMLAVLRGETILHPGSATSLHLPSKFLVDLKVWFCLTFECVMALVESQNFSTYNSQQRIMQRRDNLGLIEDDMTHVGARGVRLF